MLIIFSGFNQRAVIAFVRELKKIKYEDYCIIACGNEDSILKTEYSHKIFAIRQHIELFKPEIYSILAGLVKVYEHTKHVIVPSTEALDRFLLDNREEIEAIGIYVPLVSKALYETVSDKQSFWEVCKYAGLVVPEKTQISVEYDKRYVAKPKKYISSSGIQLKPVIVDNEKKHRAFLKDYNESDYDIQEYIDGESIYLLFYLAKTGKNYAYSQRNMIQQPDGKSILIAESCDTHTEKVAETYIELLRDMSFWGFIMIELRKKDGIYYMIEANPRLWGPSQLFVDADVPFIEAFMYDCNLCETIPQIKDEKYSIYLWSGGFKNNVSEERKCVWLEGGKEFVVDNIEIIEKSDLYNRSDTIEIFKDELPEGSLETWIEQI